MTEEEAAQLRKENQELREALKETQERLRVALARIEEVEKQKTPPPAFVKAEVKKPATQENKPRKKREAQYNRARKRAVPTQIVEHRMVECPACHLRLGGISLARCREVIDVPPAPVVEVSEHRIYKGWCSSCQKWHEAPVDFGEQVIGQGRIGVRLASMIAYLRTVMRLPLRQVREVLRTLHGFEEVAGSWQNSCIASRTMHSPSSMASKPPSVPVQRCRRMKPDGEKMAAMATSGAFPPPAFVITNTIILVAGKWSSNSLGRTIRACWAVIFMLATIYTTGCISAVGSTSYAISMISKSS